jgi:excisionase family DNA binding protein
MTTLQNDSARLLMAVEAAQLMGVSRQRVSQLVLAGRLPATRVGHLTLISPESITDWLRNRKHRNRNGMRSAQVT